MQRVIHLETQHHVLEGRGIAQSQIRVHVLSGCRGPHPSHELGVAVALVFYKHPTPPIASLRSPPPDKERCTTRIYAYTWWPRGSTSDKSGSFLVFPLTHHPPTALTRHSSRVSLSPLQWVTLHRARASPTKKKWVSRGGRGQCLVAVRSFDVP